MLTLEKVRIKKMMNYYIFGLFLLALESDYNSLSTRHTCRTTRVNKIKVY